MIKVGFAKDIHKFKKGSGFKLGGIFINSKKSFIAHSDGDVVLHSISEAILGALALGDLGKYFPPNDEKYLNIDSILILNKCLSLMSNKGYFINNVDISIELEKIFISSYIDEIRNNLSKILNINKKNISVKAMTNEGLDSSGKGKACISYCVILLENKNE